MSAASSKACVVCQASSSKYKCPKCTGPTCSLICSKKHKGDVHPDNISEVASTSSNISNQASTSSNAYDTELLPPLKQFSNSNETIAAPNAHNFGNIDKFIPMNAYDEANMLEDFEYLQFMGRSIASVGRDLIKKGWYKESDQEGDSKKASGSAGQMSGRNSGSSSKTQGSRFNNSSEKPSSEVRNRQQYEQSIRKLKVPIMLLPDGMSARKENQSKFKMQQQQLMCTVQISFPCGLSEDRRSKRIIQHHIPWNRSIEEIVRSEMTKRLRVNTVRGKDIPDQNVGNDGDQSVGAWEALFGTQNEMDINTFEDIRDQITIAIPVHSEKLRNETSARFLEWWQRQVRNGMVLEGGLKFDEEKKLSLEKKRNGEWAPIEGLIPDEKEKEGMHDLIQSATVSSAADNSMEQSNLISSFLLSRLQSQRDVQKKKESDLKEDIMQHHNDTKDPFIDEKSQTAKRHLVVLQGKETIENVLRRLMKGYAIVEYPHIEVWESAKLSQKFASGMAERVQLLSADGEMEIEGKEEMAAIDKNALKRQAAGALQHESIKKSKPTSALIGLSAYASSEDESADEEEI